MNDFQIEIAGINASECLDFQQGDREATEAKVWDSLVVTAGSTGDNFTGFTEVRKRSDDLGPILLRRMRLVSVSQ